MFRLTLILIFLCSPSLLVAVLRKERTVIVDSVSGEPLPSASVFNRKGGMIGVCSESGLLPLINHADYPLTIRYTGYLPAVIARGAPDTVRMREMVTELPEIVVSSFRGDALRLIGYLREYSTLTSYSDTILLFREKIVDFVIPRDRRRKVKGWLTPRMLASRSYYRFLSSSGLDSVSDRYREHFSWSDWVGIIDRVEMPLKIRCEEFATDTLPARHGHSQLWSRECGDVRLDFNVLADTLNRALVPGIGSYMHDGLEFSQFKVGYNFSNVGDSLIWADNITTMGFTIESAGRGKSMFRVFRKNEPYYVNTFGELYITGRESLSAAQVRRLEKYPPKADEVIIEAPEFAPELDESIVRLVSRVEGIDQSGGVWR